MVTILHGAKKDCNNVRQALQEVQSQDMEKQKTKADCVTVHVSLHTLKVMFSQDLWSLTELKSEAVNESSV